MLGEVIKWRAKIIKKATVNLINSMILIADSGSTKTDWLLIGSNGRFSFQTEGFNPFYQTTDDIIAKFRTTLLPNLQQPQAITAIYYYGTGITDDSKRDILTKAFEQTVGKVPTIEIESDMLGAARALFQHQSGIACILGTGSNTAFYDGQKISFQVPTWGFWLGDEGSGGHLGKLLVLAYIHNELPNEIKNRFEAKFGILSRAELLETAYRKPFPNRYFASFTSFLSENKSEKFIQEKIIFQSFQLFFEKSLLKYPQFSSSTIGFVGSVGFYFQEFIQPILQEKGNKYEQAIFLKSPIERLRVFHNR